MKAEKLLQIIDENVDVCTELGIAFISRVYEYLKQSKEFMFKITEESLNSNGYEMTEGLWSLDSSDFCNTTCGLDDGPFGFKFTWDMGYFDSLEYAGETYLDNVAAYSNYFSGWDDLIKAIEALDSATKPMEDEELVEMMFTDGGLWDTLSVFYAGYMDYIPDYASDEVKCSLMKCIVAAWLDSWGEGIYSNQNVCAISNPGLDEWLSFLRVGVVSKTDRKRSKELLGKLLSTDMSSDCCNTEIMYYSYPKDSKALYCKSAKCEEVGREFYMVLIQVQDNGYYGGPAVTSFRCGVISPAMMAAMFNVKQFLEEMEEKYRFLSHRKEVETYGKAA